MRRERGGAFEEDFERDFFWAYLGGARLQGRCGTKDLVPFCVTLRENAPWSPLLRSGMTRIWASRGECARVSVTRESFREERVCLGQRNEI